MRNRKKKLRLIYVGFTIALVLLLIGGGYFVYAAMTAIDQKENDFQVGQVETELMEENFIAPTEINKDESINKKVSIKNNGTINQFIRVMVLPEVKANVSGDPNNKQVLSLVIGTDLILENLNTTDWRYGDDGYYYYIKEAVKPNDPTSSLFESVRLSNSISDQYHNAEFSISLKVETINCLTTAYRQAWWQGNTPTEDPLASIDTALSSKVDN
ncbi:TasA family protein [Candidatus Enterococcus ferrettii]|uniref:Alternate signal-mediated exported protein, CPF_0494 family n=1 Tax=Candidatus Enterococcus ferrettii TaxID=2815324 RepID=A0ABV0EVS6_9ENTE|nr:TasA family protein [Enterococcus sp. 665A]MBO1343070.1 hypothetical protein [Enterococcus sp. 665A]